jgi:hypothetical protein
MGQDYFQKENRLLSLEFEQLKWELWLYQQ